MSQAAIKLQYCLFAIHSKLKQDCHAGLGRRFRMASKSSKAVTSRRTDREIIDITADAGHLKSPVFTRIRLLYPTQNALSRIAQMNSHSTIRISLGRVELSFTLKADPDSRFGPPPSCRILESHRQPLFIERLPSKPGGSEDNIRGVRFVRREVWIETIPVVPDDELGGVISSYFADPVSEHIDHPFHPLTYSV